MGLSVISFDLDGVLAEPPLGWNPAINRDVSLRPVEQPLERPGDLTPSDSSDRLGTILTHTWYRARYLLRPPRPGALAAVRAAARAHSVIVLTGRHERGRRQTAAWLDRHGFGPSLDDLVMNAGPLPSARHKEAQLARRPATLHVDDDAATVALLARTGITVALLDWPRNRDLVYPNGVTRYLTMDELAAALSDGEESCQAR